LIQQIDRIAPVIGAG